MKRFFLISVALFLLTLFAGCRQQEEISIGHQACAVIDHLTFSSLEEFLAGYLIAREGRTDGDITALVESWQVRSSNTELGDVVESVSFTSLENLYLPIGIPDGFQIHVIRVNEEVVNIRFLHEDDMVSEEAIWDAIVRQRDFRFNFTRWDLDSPMDGIFEQFHVTEEDLLDGRYLFLEPNFFIWASDREVLYMYMPLNLPPRPTRGTDEHMAAMVGFAEIRVVNLLDSNEVLALIEATMDDSRGGDRIWELIEAATDYRREDVR